MAELLAIARGLERLTDAALVAALERLSPEARKEISVALADVGAAAASKKKLECGVCHKLFDRKWNRDRHEAQHEKNNTATTHGCPFDGCAESFASSLLLVEHFAVAHGLDTKSAKRPRVVVRHDDHFDLLLPSGALLHMGENGVTQRVMGDATGSSSDPTGATGGGGGGGDRVVTQAHTHDFVGGASQPVAHGDHFDVLVGAELHCEYDPCRVVDSMEIGEGDAWDAFIKSSWPNTDY